MGESEWFETFLFEVPVWILEVSPPAPEACLEALRQAAGGWLPDDYMKFMLEQDGLNGNVGADMDSGSFLILYDCERAKNPSEAYNMPDFEPTMYELGTNGGGTAYLIDRSSQEWVELPYLDFGDSGDSRLERRFPDMKSMFYALAYDPV